MSAKRSLLTGIGAGLVAALGAMLWSHTVSLIGILVWTGMLIPCGLATTWIADSLLGTEKPIAGAKGLGRMFACMAVGVVVVYCAAVALNVIADMPEPFALSNIVPGLFIGASVGWMRGDLVQVHMRRGGH